MRFQCEHCQGISAVGPEDFGRQVRCGHCSDVSDVPETRYSKGAVIDDFVLDRRIGQGAMGTVYLAHQISLDRPVALKVLRDDLANNSGFVVEFVKDSRAAARLNHPNIVQSLAVGEEDGVYFFAMEYVEGDSLAETLAERGRLPAEEATSIARQIAEALSYAWQEQQLVHRDVKPENVMITARGMAKLTDLGLARPVDVTDLDEGEFPGTPQFVAPEQLLGDSVDQRTDIYGLGATFYYAATGRLPYADGAGSEVARRQIEESPMPPNKACSEVSGDLGAIIMRMMARDPGDRYPDAGAVLNDIDRLRRGEKPAAAKGRGARATGRAATTKKGSASTGRSAGTTGSSSMAGKKMKIKSGGSRRGAPKVRNRPTGAAPAAAPTGVVPGQQPPQKQSALPWILGVIAIVALAVVGIVAKNVHDKFTPRSPAEAETLYLSQETLQPGERERYQELKKFIGKAEDYSRNPDQLNYVSDLAKRFTDEYPNSIFSRTPESINYAQAFGAMDYFEDSLRKAASPLAGSVAATRYTYDELYVKDQRQKQRLVEEAEIDKYRYSERLREMQERVAAWGQERQEKLSAAKSTIEENLDKRAEAFKVEQADMLSRSLDLGNALEFGLASKRAADAIGLVENYPMSIERMISDEVRGTEFERSKKWRHQLAHDLDLDVSLVGEEHQKIINQQDLEQLKQQLPPYIEKERGIMRKRSAWLTKLSESLQFAAEYHDPISGSHKKLASLRLKLPQYLKKDILTRHEVTLCHRDTVVMHIKEWSEEGAWAVMENARIPYMDLPYSEYDKLAVAAAGSRVSKSEMALRRGAFYYWRLRLDMGLDQLGASARAEGRFMQDHAESIKALQDTKTVKWVAERVIRLLDAKPNPDKQEKDQKLELIKNQKLAQSQFGLLKQRYEGAEAWQENEDVVGQAVQKLQEL